MDQIEKALAVAAVIAGGYLPPDRRRQAGRYNPNAPDWDAVHRPGPWWLRSLRSAPAVPAPWLLDGEMSNIRADRAAKCAARRLAAETALAVGSRKWACLGVLAPIVLANTKSEARARFKAIMDNRFPGLPLGAVVIAV